MAAIAMYKNNKSQVVSWLALTWLFGAGIQTCKKIIDSGFIGRPIGAAAFMICHGHESWHTAPELYYQTGGGPMMDMGPYYLTALVNLMGSVKGLTGIAKKNFEQRLITSEPLYGKIIDVEVPTHYNGIRSEERRVGKECFSL